MEKFEQIREKMTLQHQEVAPGKMMSSEAICYRKKVFAFYHLGKMTFRLGKDFDLTKYGIATFDYLSPFRNKPPMMGWYMIGPEYKDQWLLLANEALLRLQKEVDA